MDHRQVILNPQTGQTIMVTTLILSIYCTSLALPESHLNSPIHLELKQTKMNSILVQVWNMMSLTANPNHLSRSTSSRVQMFHHRLLSTRIQLGCISMLIRTITTWNMRVFVYLGQHHRTLYLPRLKNAPKILLKLLTLVSTISQSPGRNQAQAMTLVRYLQQKKAISQDPYLMLVQLQSDTTFQIHLVILHFVLLLYLSWLVSLLNHLINTIGTIFPNPNWNVINTTCFE